MYRLRRRPIRRYGAHVAPLIITREQVDEVVAILDTSVGALEARL